jgi:1,4-dihydroxy-6-naphthoate synthase
LGCIAAHIRLGQEAPKQLDNAIRKSIASAYNNPEATFGYIRTHAQEMTRQVLDAHIHTFVNEFSLDIGGRGRQAVAALEEKARQTGIIS